jgi:exopolysaccharide biosynthesis polyprenyl glycosylphosphotransferase
LRPAESISAESPGSLSTSGRRSGGPATRTRPAEQRIPLARRLLDGPGFVAVRVGVDLVTVSCAVAAAIVGAHSAGVSTEGEAWLYVFPLLVVFFLHLRGMYRQKVLIQILDGVGPLVGAISVAAMTIIAGMVVFSGQTPSGALIARAWVFSMLYVGAGRTVLALSQRRARSSGLLSRPTLIVGAGQVGAQIARRLEERPEYGMRPIGFLDADPPPAIDVVDRRSPVLGGPDDLAEVAADTGASQVILAFSSAPDRGLVPLVRRCDELGLEVSLVPRLYESINERIVLEHLGGMPLLELRTVDPKGWQFTIKHGFDRLFATFALIGLSPLLLALTIAVKLSSPGPTLYRQRRIGRDGTDFDLLKFRSMRPATRSEGDFTPEAGTAPGGVEGVDRRTRIGRFMRRTSLDELPQLINVLRGEMSLVGPRPERPEFVELFRRDIERYSDRHRVKSGITGWAQVHGLRGQTSLSDRVEWDNFYIENWSLWLDIKILLLTVRAVVIAAEEP